MKLVLSKMNNTYKTDAPSIFQEWGDRHFRRSINIERLERIKCLKMPAFYSRKLATLYAANILTIVNT